MGSILEQLSDEISDLTQSVIPSVVTLQIESAGGGAVASGFFVDSAGHILTNAHPFAYAPTRITILLVTGESYEGTLIGTDVDTDTAVVKLVCDDVDNRPGSSLIATQGNSDRLRIGEIVLVAGSPLNFTTTVTMGIVSATGRRLESQNGRPMSGVIQTDAAINPGSSGGPMFNSKGEVVGINTAIIANAQGIGFAIPINVAKRISDILIAEGSVKRPVLGLSLIEAEDLDGVLIEYVSEEGSAWEAGLEVDDVVCGINGKPVRTTDDAYRLISDLAGQSKTTFEISRNEGEPFEVPMELVYE